MTPMMTTKIIAEQQPVEQPQLTSLRFFAAFAVLCSHLIFLREIDNPIKPIAIIFFNEGYSGVTFFFVLSGFILTHAYHNGLIQKTLSTKTYLLLRLSRIWPLHVITALPFICYFLYRHSEDLSSIVTVNVLLLQSWVPLAKYYMSLNAVSWSLSDELFFYVSFILLVRFSVKSLKKAALAWFCVIATAAAIMIFYGYGYWAGPNGELKISHWLFYINPAVRLLDFMVGILVYRLTFVKTNKSRNASLLEIASVGCLILGAYIYSTFVLPEILRAQLLYLPLMAFIIYSFSNGTGILSKFLKRKTLVLLGEASFSLYLVHNPIIMFAYSAYQKMSLNVPILIFSIILMACCVIASLITYKFIELPIHRYLKKQIKSRDKSRLVSSNHPPGAARSRPQHPLVAGDDPQ